MKTAAVHGHRHEHKHGNHLSEPTFASTGICARPGIATGPATAPMHPIATGATAAPRTATTHPNPATPPVPALTAIGHQAPQRHHAPDQATTTSVAARLDRDDQPDPATTTRPPQGHRVLSLTALSSTGHQARSGMTTFALALAAPSLPALTASGPGPAAASPLDLILAFCR